MNNLRQAAQQALEDICGARLCEVNSMSSRREALRLLGKAADVLRAALAEPDRHALQAEGKHPAPCARHCEAKAFEIEIRMLKAAMKQEQEPAGYRIGKDGEREYVYTTPPQRKPLTEEEIVQVLGSVRENITGNVFLAFARAIEQAHGIKGEA